MTKTCVNLDCAKELDTEAKFCPLCGFPQTPPWEEDAPGPPKPPAYAPAMPAGNRDPLPSDGKLSCRTCGSSRVRVWEETAVREEAEAAACNRRELGLWVCGCIAFPCLLLAAYFTVAHSPDADSHGDAVAMTLLLGIPAFLTWFLLLLITPRADTNLWRTLYGCQDCGYSWEKPRSQMTWFIWFR